MQGIFYSFFFRCCNLQHNRSPLSRFHALDNVNHGRCGIFDDTHFKFQNENKKSFLKMSCRVCDNHSNRIFCRRYRKPATSHECVGLFITKIQHPRSNLPYLFCCMVCAYFTCNLSFKAYQKSFIKKQFLSIPIPFPFDCFVPLLSCTKTS